MRFEHYKPYLIPIFKYGRKSTIKRWAYASAYLYPNSQKSLIKWEANIKIILQRTAPNRFFP